MIGDSDFPSFYVCLASVFFKLYQNCSSKQRGKDCRWVACTRTGSRLLASQPSTQACDAQTSISEMRSCLWLQPRQFIKKGKSTSLNFMVHRHVRQVSAFAVHVVDKM
ncbi:unnamed protein product [Ixodes pacificus]